MTDHVDSRRRSAIMSSVQTKNTGPEIVVRKLLHRLGYRYSLHRSDLPGRPDLAFAPLRKAIFVHGCFWHGHGCRWGKLPKSKLDYWAPKIAANRARDRRKRAELKRAGWRTLSVWQCELRNVKSAQAKMEAFLES
jgi:DNA mismatch endonuclease (patch repair protein)